jgi:hypothetical protein
LEFFTLRNIDEEKVNKRNENNLSLIKEPWNSRSNNVKTSTSQKGPRYTRRNPILFLPPAMQLLSNFVQLDYNFPYDNPYN